MSEQLIQTPCAFGENGNFLLERELGSGGMGGVYMGRDKMLDRPVAVKVMVKELGADPEFVEKFKREAQAAAKLIHPNIAQIYSYGICDGMPYMAMELAAGGSLYTIMTANPGKTDVARVFKICQQVAQALQCASDQGCVHGDVKPENILLDANGNAKLVDFGLAGMQKDTDEIWGTPYYISPEKVRKEPIDFRADIYSLGGTLYHALTGVAPFEGADSIAVVKKRFEGTPRKPSEIRPELTKAIDDLVMKMLALEKENRYPSFEALLEAFRDVLASGLTAKSAAASTTSAAKPKPVTTGAKRMTVRGRRMTMATRPGLAPKRLSGTSVASEKARELSAAENEAEEEGGNLGLKVLGAIVGGILLIGGVIGGLVWYQVADKKSRAAEEQAQIVGGISKARGAIVDTLTKATNFACSVDREVDKTVGECQRWTDKLKRVLPAEQGEALIPPPTKELLAAIASTNEVPKEAATTNATATVASTNVTAAAAGELAGASAAAVPRFREPTEEEKDPASPEGEKYLQERKAWMDAQMQMKTNAQATAEALVKAEEPKKEEPVAQAVLDMRDLWERAYACQASAIRIRASVNGLIKECETAEEIKGQTKESMEKLADLTRSLAEKLESIKTSKDVETIRKGFNFIKSKGAKTLEVTERQIRREKLEKERKEKAEAAAAAEKERLARLAKEREAKVAEEIAAAKAKFVGIVAQGCMRQLDWKSALRQLENAKAEMTTPEGQLACDLEIRKVNDMKAVQDLFIKNIKGHTFRGKLSKCKVADVNESEIVILKPDGKSKQKILWQTFYKDYPGNLNELINGYIFNARNTSAKVKLSLRDWSNAMTGAALTMQLVCAEVNGAMERAETLVKEVVKQFPDYQKTAHEIFPDITFEAAAEE